VWQSFNRRTFQPMFSLKGNSAYTKLSWLDDVPALEPLKVSDKEILTEGLFGKIVRIYLDSIQSKSNTHLGSLSNSELTKTVFAMLNPAQVETIALHICNDLQFIADVGMGKGLDVADVKGTVRHLDSAQRSARINRAITKLESVGVNFSERLRTNIEATSSLRFQCKARPTSASEDLGTVLLIDPGVADSKRTDVLFLENLATSKPNDFQMFHDWLEVLRFDLKSAH